MLAAGRLQIEFFRQGDRYAHRISLAGDDRPVELLVSVEGGGHVDGPNPNRPDCDYADDAWPASPPFQELRIEPRSDGRQVALLVGMAGRSHWSASVEADPQLGRFTFDVACRAARLEPAPG